MPVSSEKERQLSERGRVSDSDFQTKTKRYPGLSLVCGSILWGLYWFAVMLCVVCSLYRVIVVCIAIDAG